MKSKLRTFSYLLALVLSTNLWAVANEHFDNTRVSTAILSGAGGNFVLDLAQGEWALGESIADTTLVSENFLLTPGFCQAVLSSVTVQDLPDEQMDAINLLSVYPVPTRDNLHFNIDNPLMNDFVVSIHDQLGIEVYRSKVKGDFGIGKLDVTELISSVYYIEIYNGITKKLIGVRKFVKLRE